MKILSSFALRCCTVGPTRFLSRCFVVSLFTILAASCTWLPPTESTELAAATASDASQSQASEVTATEVMVRDLISAIVQIMPPSSTTVQVSLANSTELDKLVEQALALRGFGLQKVLNDQGANLVSTDLKTTSSADSTSSSRLFIGIGAISISRSYNLIADEAVQPASPYKLYGTRATIDVASTLFGASGYTDMPLSDTEYGAPISLDEPLPALSLITPELVQRVVESTVGGPERTSFNSAKVEVNNLLYSDSTFGSVLDEYEQLDELVVIFPNDSVVMGKENRQLIRRFIDQFVEEKDVISVVGCSNGPTSSDLGNAGLALGRAERVTAELVSIGVAREKVLDEGCWAPQGGIKTFPGRGVVIQLWRNA